MVITNKLMNTENIYENPVSNESEKKNISTLNKCGHYGCGWNWNCILLIFLLFGGVAVLLYFLLFLSSVQSGTSWGGANSYYVWTCSEQYQNELFTMMRDGGFKVLRVFMIKTTDEGYPGECGNYPDIENPVGVFQSTTIDKFNRMLYLASAYNIKIILAMHDRWSLGCWRSDAYVIKYNLPAAADPSTCNNILGSDNNPTLFYNDQLIINDFKNRLKYMLNISNPYLNNTKWGDLTNVFYSFEAQNEYLRGYVNPTNKKWICEISKYLKTLTNIKISSGGGIECIDMLFTDSLVNCEGIDMITLHDYNPKSVSKVILSYTVFHANNNGKKVILAEFGSSELLDIKDHVDLANSYGVPWMVWSLDKANKGLSIWNNSNIFNYLSDKCKAINF